MSDKNGMKLDGLPEGIAVSAKVMPNGEARSRISHSETGLSVSITSTFETPGACGWQNSHRHTSGIVETYVVQTGWLVVAHQDGPTSTPLFRRYGAGKQVVLTGEDAHNVYVGEGTVFACVKSGSAEGRNDWTPVPDFDVLVRSFSEAEMLSLCR